MSKNTNKPLIVSNCHHAAILETNGKQYCSTCKQECAEVEHLVEDNVSEEDDTR